MTPDMRALSQRLRETLQYVIYPGGCSSVAVPESLLKEAIDQAERVEAWAIAWRANDGVLSALTLTAMEEADAALLDLVSAPPADAPQEQK